MRPCAARCRGGSVSRRARRAVSTAVARSDSGRERARRRVPAVSDYYLNSCRDIWAFRRRRCGSCRSASTSTATSPPRAANGAVHGRLLRARGAREGTARAVRGVPSGCGEHPSGRRAARGGRLSGAGAPGISGRRERLLREAGLESEFEYPRRGRSGAEDRAFSRAWTCCRCRRPTTSRRGCFCWRRWRAACPSCSRGVGAFPEIVEKTGGGADRRAGRSGGAGGRDPRAVARPGARRGARRRRRRRACASTTRSAAWRTSVEAIMRAGPSRRRQAALRGRALEEPVRRAKSC